MKSVELETPFHGAGTIGLVLNALSFLALILVIAIYFVFPALRRLHSSYVLCVASVGALFHLLILICGTAKAGTPCHHAFASHVAFEALQLYIFALAFRFYFSAKHPFSPFDKYSLIIHIFIWIVPAGMTAIVGHLLDYKQSIAGHGLCWYEFPGRDEVGAPVGDLFGYLAFFSGPVILGFCASFVWHIAGTKLLRKGSRIAQNFEYDSSLLKFLVFSLLYLCLIGQPYYIRVAKVVELNSPTEKAIRCCGRFLLAMLGFNIVFLWVLVAKLWSAVSVWKHGDWDQYLRYHEASWLLRKQMLALAARGCQKGAQLSVRDDDSEYDEVIHKNVAPASRWYAGPLSGENTENIVNVKSFHVKGHDGEPSALFRDFAPEDFREIRRMSNISDESYSYSFDEHTYERYSAGKSGSFMYYTGDQRFILKTCSEQELNYLLQILPQYTDHLSRFPQTYLCRYVGCHEIVTKHHRVCFIVFTNILTNQQICIDEFFDLKGSWVGRARVPAKRGDQRVCKYCGKDFIVGMSKEHCPRAMEDGKGHEHLGIGKDMDWSWRRLGVPLDAANQLSQQLQDDSVFLESVRSMDYSLAIGLSRRELSLTRENSSFVWRALREMSDTNHAYLDEESDDTYQELASPRDSQDKGSYSRDVCVVYMGIIDILTPWSFQKKVEHWIKTHIMWQDPHGISCMHPSEYAARFRKNVVDLVIFGESDGNGESVGRDSIMVDFTGGIRGSFNV